MITFVKVPIGVGRGVSCRLCSSTDEPEDFLPAASILEQVADVVERWRVGPGPNVAYVGAEPFRHPELPALVRSAIEAGAERLCLATDARALAHNDNASGSVSAGVRHIQARLLGGHAQTHDALSGSPGSFEETLAGMRALATAGQAQSVPVLVCGRVHVCGHNVKELPDIVLAFSSVGASSVTLEFDGSVPTSVARPWVSAAIETGVINNVWVDLEGLTAEELHVHPLHNITTVHVQDEPTEAAS